MNYGYFPPPPYVFSDFFSPIVLQVDYLLPPFFKASDTTANCRFVVCRFWSPIVAALTVACSYHSSATRRTSILSTTVSSPAPGLLSATTSPASNLCSTDE
ncbi:hypothetical protein L2E82_06365 [Cichorium intybus]|uniref:Uncharacterized protein n=1 Tax=Cichorium intybus TaxID=13427 RepID=A0ACB9HBC4_CICIN|nr:hypothetical protein L2E82_06365 [Cichorium intybus]